MAASAATPRHARATLRASARATLTQSARTFAVPHAACMHAATRHAMPCHACSHARAWCQRKQKHGATCQAAPWRMQKRHGVPCQRSARMAPAPKPAPCQCAGGTRAVPCHASNACAAKTHHACQTPCAMPPCRAMPRPIGLSPPCNGDRREQGRRAGQVGAGENREGRRQCLPTPPAIGGKFQKQVRKVDPPYNSQIHDDARYFISPYVPAYHRPNRTRAIRTSAETPEIHNVQKPMISATMPHDDPRSIAQRDILITTNETNSLIGIDHKLFNHYAYAPTPTSWSA